MSSIAGDMAYFIVSVLGKSAFQEFVGQHAGLRQPIHPLLDLNVNKTIGVDFVFQIVFCDDFIGNLSYLNFHVFWVLHWHIEIKGFDVKTTIFSFWLGQGAVDVYFECDKVTCSCGDGVWIVDEITPVPLIVFVLVRISGVIRHRQSAHM